MGGGESKMHHRSSREIEMLLLLLLLCCDVLEGGHLKSTRGRNCFKRRRDPESIRT